MYAEGVEGVIKEEMVSVVRRRTRVLAGLGTAHYVTQGTLLSRVETVREDYCPTKDYTRGVLSYE